MNRMSKIGHRFRSKFKLVTGQEFYGQLLDIPDTSRVSNFLSARRYLRTSIDTFVVPGDVAVINGLKYIVAEHGTGFFVKPVYRHFKLFEVDLELQWYSNSQMVDPITDQLKVSQVEQTDLVYLSTQPRSSQQDQIHIPGVLRTTVCNKKVLVNDKLGEDYLVTKSDHVLGITLLELKVR